MKYHEIEFGNGISKIKIRPLLNDGITLSTGTDNLGIYIKIEGEVPNFVQIARLHILELINRNNLKVNEYKTDDRSRIYPVLSFQIIQELAKEEVTPEIA